MLKTPSFLLQSPCDYVEKQLKHGDRDGIAGISSRPDRFHGSAFGPQLSTKFHHLMIGLAETDKSGRRDNLQEIVAQQRDL